MKKYLIALILFISRTGYSQTYITDTKDTIVIGTQQVSIPVVTIKKYVVPPTTIDRKNLTFDPGTDITKWPVKGTDTTYGITNATISNKTAIRFEVRKSDPIFAGGLRAELNRYSDVNTSTYEVWYGLSYFVPTDWVTDQPNLFDIVNQWHDNTYGTSDGTEYKSPFDFSIDGTQWKWQIRYGTGSEKSGYAGTVEKGKWVDFVFHIKFVKTGTAGQVEIWKDGVKTNTYNGPVGYNHYYAPFFKMGIYKWPWNPQDLACCGATNSTQHVIYISNFRLGNNLATYNDVKP